MGAAPDNGDYGFSVTDRATSTTTNILPLFRWSDSGHSFSTSSTSYVADSNMPTLTVTVGASGEVMLLVNAYIGVPPVGGVQSGGVHRDLAQRQRSRPARLMSFSTSACPQPHQASGSRITPRPLLSSPVLTAGANTFEMQFKTVGGGSVTFDNRFLQVQPL